MTPPRWKVRAETLRFRVTCFCDTPEEAAAQLRYYRGRAYDTITVFDPADRIVTPEKLEVMTSEVEHVRSRWARVDA